MSTSRLISRTSICRRSTPKAPLPKTPAFYEIVNANQAPEDNEPAFIIDKLGSPAALTLKHVSERAKTLHLKAKVSQDFVEWLGDMPEPASDTSPT